MDVFRLRGNDDTPVLRFGDVVTQGPSHRVERQRSVRQTLDEFQAGHLVLLIGADGPVCPAGNTARHLPSSSEDRGWPDASYLPLALPAYCFLILRGTGEPSFI